MSSLAILFVVAFISTSSSSVRAAIDQCAGGGCVGYTINHVYGSDGPVTSNGLPASQETLKGDTGRPGKAGPQGVPGTVGEKGERGDTGPRGPPCQCDNTELNKLKEEVAALISSMNVSNENFERKLVEIQKNFNKTNSELRDFPKSCAAVGTDRSGFYTISPEPNKVLPFYVYCNFSDGDEVWTTISHDSVDEVEVTCEDALCHKHNVNYDVSMNQIKALINISRSCRQYIKYRCMGSIILTPEYSQYAAWISRDGEQMTYWGGATSRRDRYCACGETGTCIDASQKCNCDKNSSPETSDEGYLTDKSKLPVTAMWFGDAGESSEWGRHSLGKLECTGTA